MLPRLALLCCVYFAIFGSITDCLGQAKPGPDSVQWFRGNLHTHSLWSDGNDFPEMIAEWYHNNGYHFLALTDHNILSEGEKWMSVDEIVRRSSANTIDKLESAFGQDWIEWREEKGKKQIRLKTLAEFRQKFEVPGKFLMMAGEEISDSVNGLPLHMNATNLKYLIEPAGGKTIVEAMNKNLRVAFEQSKNTGEPMLVHLNHPNFGWAVTAEDIAQVTLERFFEVYNGHPAINHLGAEGRPSVERMWDIANTIRIDQLKSQPLLGLATDDSHHYHGVGTSRNGRGWVMVRATELSPRSVIDSMYRGDFYCSSGVSLAELETGESGIELQIDGEPGETYTTQFIGTLKDYDRTTTKPTVIKNAKGKPLRISRVYSDDVGKVLKTVEGKTAVYKFTGEELYVRAVVTSSADHVDPSFKDQKKQAWTQPVVVK